MAITEQGNEKRVYSEKNVAAQYPSVLKEISPRASIMMAGTLEAEIPRQQRPHQ